MDDVTIRRKAEDDLESISNRIAELEAERAKIRAFIEMFARYASPTVSSVEQLPLGLREMTIAGGCAAIMKASGGSAKTTDMIRMLREAGKMRGKGRGDYGTVVKTLERSPERFEKVSPGLWRLVKHDPEPERRVDVESPDAPPTLPSSPSLNGIGSYEGHPVATG